MILPEMDSGLYTRSTTLTTKDFRPKHSKPKADYRSRRLDGRIHPVSNYLGTVRHS